MGRRTRTSFQPGQPKPPTSGRKRGTPNAVPGSFKASLKRALEEVVTEEYAAVKAAVRAGLVADPPKSIAYITLAAHYLDGKPKDLIQLDTSQPILFMPPAAPPVPTNGHALGDPLLASLGLTEDDAVPDDAPGAAPIPRRRPRIREESP